jgi:hypothetical protein
MEQTIWQEYQDEEFICFGINFNESEETVREFADNFGLTFPLLLDPQGFTYMTYRIEYCQSPFPQDYIIDPDGLIAYKACEYFPDSMITVIEGLLDEMSTDVPEPPVTDLRGPRIEFIWPNPTGTEGRVAYILPEPSVTRVDIMDASGRRVRRLWYGRQEGGPQLVVWDGLNDSAQAVPAGTYFVRVAARGQVDSRKISVLR